MRCLGNIPSRGGWGGYAKVLGHWGGESGQTDSPWTCSSSLQWNHLENYKQSNDRTSPKGRTLAAETRSRETVEQGSDGVRGRSVEVE